MVKYLLRKKFPNHPDYQWAFDKVVLTVESDGRIPTLGDDTPEPSSEELSEYEYDVLLYLKEDKERRKKDKKRKHITCLRYYLKKIVICVKWTYGFFYGILTLLPKYICHVPKPSRSDPAFKKQPRLTKDDVLPYLKNNFMGDNLDHNKSPPWPIIVNVILDSLAEADK